MVYDWVYFLIFEDDIFDLVEFLLIGINLLVVDDFINFIDFSARGVEFLEFKVVIMITIDFLNFPLGSSQNFWRRLFVHFGLRFLGIEFSRGIGNKAMEPDEKIEVLLKLLLCYFGYLQWLQIYIDGVGVVEFLERRDKKFEIFQGLVLVFGFGVDFVEWEDMWEKSMEDEKVSSPISEVLNLIIGEAIATGDVIGPIDEFCFAQGCPGLHFKYYIMANEL